MNENNTKSFLIPILLLVLILIISVVSINGYISIEMFKIHLQDDINRYKKEYLYKNKTEIYDKVHLVDASIEFQMKRIEEKLKKTLKTKVETSINIAQYIYEKDKNKLSVRNMREKIAHYLKAIKLDNNGYYFIYDYKTNIMLSHVIKQYINKDMTNATDVNGQKLTPLYKKALKNKKIGFVKNYFYKPNDSTKEYPKMVCIAKFEPLGIVIGTGEYLDTVEKELKTVILNRFEKNRKKDNNYVFLYELHNIKGGENFATMILNQNRPDLIGKKISDDYEDAKGKKFRREFLKEIRLKGESYTKYWYKKPHMNEPKPKMSYFYLQKDWNWIIACGFYYDDLNKQINEMKKSFDSYLKQTITQTIVYIGLLSLLAIIIATIVSLRIDNTIKDYIVKLSKKSKELEDLNETLENEIDKALNENTKQLQTLQQQSKMAQMGEMIGAIAHQWRQPLNTIGTSIQNLEYDYLDGHLNDKDFINNFIEKNKKTIKFMSKTIDDFRSFFRVDKQKTDFDIKETTQSVIDMQSAQLQSDNISVEILGDGFSHNGYASEYQQVILNIINNAKDALIEKNIENPAIKIILKNSTISICDNARGIPSDILDRIFEPYFTTKEQGKGTGMGLYMSKMIIEDNMNGELSVSNDKNGAIFMIKFKG